MIVQSWLDLLCQMIPKVKRGVFVDDLSTDTAPQVCWPNKEASTPELLAAIKLTGNSRTPLVHLGSSVSHHSANAMNKSSREATTIEREAVETIVAHPLIVDGHLYGVVAIQADINPSQQTVVKQLILCGFLLVVEVY